MRVFRTILGMLLLTTGLPALLAGGGLWAVMQHRDPGGGFSGELQRLTVPGYAVVVPDIDRLLRDDVPFARIGDTRLRLSAVTVDGQAFLGLAPSDEVARYLTGVPHSQIDAIDIGTGALPVTTTRTGGRQAPAGAPAQQGFWTASGTGQISLTPGELGDRPYSLVLMNPGGNPVMRIAAIAEIRPGWLNSSTWGLLTLGTLLLMLGVTVLVWPGRRREVVYVVEPSQVPELMHAIGAPLPLPGGVAYFAGPRSGGAHRPRTLADSRPRPPALPQFDWPPNGPGTPELPSGRAVPLNTATITKPIPSGTPTGTLTETRPAPARPDSAPAQARPDSAPAQARPDSAPPGPTSPVTAGAAGTRPAPADGSAAGPATDSVSASGPVTGIAAGSALTGGTAAGTGTAGAHTPAPGRPLSLLGETPALSGLQPGTVPARRGERRSAPADVPQFQATAVGAWVAATAPERARQTEARAAARLAEAARRNAGKFAPAQPGNRNMPSNARIPIAPPRRDNGEVPATGQLAPGSPAQPQTAEGTPVPATETTALGLTETADKPKSATARGRAETAGKPKPVAAPGLAGTADQPQPAEATEAGVRAEAAETAGQAGSTGLTGTPAHAEKTVSPAAADATSVVNPADETVAAQTPRGEKASRKMARREGLATARPDTTPDAVRPDASKPSALDSTTADAVPDASPAASTESVPQRTVVSRIALRTGPAATDWIATGITEIGPDRVPRPGPHASPKSVAADGPATPAQATAGPPPEWPLIGSPADGVTAPASGVTKPVTVPDSRTPVTKSAVPSDKTGVTPAVAQAPDPAVTAGPVEKAAGTALIDGDTRPAAAEGEAQPAGQPVVPFPSGPASSGPAIHPASSVTTGSTPTARPGGPRASMHVAEAAYPAPDQPGPAGEREVTAAPAPGDRNVSADESGTTTQEQAAVSRGASTTTRNRPPAAVPDPARVRPRPGGDRRSVHAVEADGLGVLPKKPAPVPTQGATTPAQTRPGPANPENAGTKPLAPELEAKPPVEEDRPRPRGESGTTEAKPAGATAAAASTAGAKAIEAMTAVAKVIEATTARTTAAAAMTAGGKPVDATTAGGKPVDATTAGGKAVDATTAGMKAVEVTMAAAKAVEVTTAAAKAVETMTAGAQAAGTETSRADVVRADAAEEMATEATAAGTKATEATTQTRAAGATAGTKAAKAKGARAKATGARTAGRKVGDDQPLVRAQGRASGKATTPRPAPAARRVPAAWIKAAESMAARTGQADGGTAPAVPEKAGTTGHPEPAGGVDGQARAGDETARPLSYREEAAELLGSGERRRRRTVAGRNRLGSGPAGADTERPKTERPNTESPKTESLRTESPKTESPKTERPKTEPPKTELPR
ncbi:hypothetical protein AB0G04_31450 [Actinoplanes sp. NPDC023801]|uniref:hypothetical protein n=1 Tax=Actinoplanes sp. NPDC023801 TaxID=3154595 RepID=UPI0033FD972B